MSHWNVLLFDVDGVIVDPRAYRLAINKTLQALLAKIGLGDRKCLFVEEAEVAYMESCGIHDIWDITNIVFAMILLQLHKMLHQLLGKFVLPDGDVSEQLAALKSLVLQHADLVEDRPRYSEFAQSITEGKGSSHPPDVAVEALCADMDNLAGSDKAEWRKLLEAFLVGTRTPYGSYGTRVFQNILLGSRQFEETYGLPSEYEGESFLREQDRVLISEQTVKRLVEFSASANNRVGIYTARPSHPPKECPDTKGYSPEAELALDMAGLSQLPLVAMGMMEWLAARVGKRPEDLTKPNATQAIAALLAGLSGQSNAEILESAYKVDKENMDPLATGFGKIEGATVAVYVFEDTVSGIKPMLEVARRLKEKGVQLEVIPIGIATEPNKVTALKKYANDVFSNVNEAVDHVLAKCAKS